MVRPSLAAAPGPRRPLAGAAAWALTAALALLPASRAAAEIEVISWVPPYSIEEAKAAAQADFGDCDAADGLTRVGLQFWVPNMDGSIKYADHEWYVPTDDDVGWWRDWCDSTGIECLLTIYNNTGSWDWPLARAAFADNEATFVAALINEMERHGLDGIDLDLEGIGDLNADRAAFDLFVETLSGELRARGKTLTIDSFHYIWNAPNHDWWSDWVGEVDNIHSMGYEDLFEGGTVYQPYSFQQQAGLLAGHPPDMVSMGMPSWLANWGVSAGRGTSAQAHVQEVHHDLVAPTGIAIWDLQLTAWMDSDLWCEIVDLRTAGGPALTKKSLVVMFDGLRSDGLVSADTPNIDRLIAGSFGGGLYRGAYAYDAQTIQDAPTSSAYNHCSIVTGVNGTTHGVADNSAAGLAAVDYDAYPHYLTTIEQADPAAGTAFLVTWDPDRSIASDADYVKVGSDAANVDRVVAILEGSHDDPAGDDGTSWAPGARIDAITLFLDDADGAGHSDGFSAAVPTYLAEVAELDAQLGLILDAIEARPTFADEDWQIVLTSDHGGLGTGHGGLNPNSETIPFVVASRTVEQGLLAGRIQNRDAATTAVAHVLGSAGIPAHHEGPPQGSAVKAAPPMDPSEGLVVHLSFDGDLQDSSGRNVHAEIGADSDVDPILHESGGPCGGYVEFPDVAGGAADASYLTLGMPRELVFGGGDFTIAVRVRASAAQSGDPVILGNKDWSSGLNIGTALLANEGGGNAFGLNLSDGALRRDVEALEQGLDEWWFLAATVDRDGSAVLFAASPDGIWHLVSDFADDLEDFDSALPWNLGQDGTGSYPDNFVGDLDELMIWRRALTLEELQELQRGFVDDCVLGLLRNAELTALSPPTPALETLLPLDAVDDLLLSPVSPGAEVPIAPGPLSYYTVPGIDTLTLMRVGANSIRVEF